MSAVWQVPQLTSNRVLQQLLNSSCHSGGEAYPIVKTKKSKN